LESRERRQMARIWHDVRPFESVGLEIVQLLGSVAAPCVMHPRRGVFAKISIEIRASIWIVSWRSRWVVEIREF
jgi:hypothetical protein